MELSTFLSCGKQNDLGYNQNSNQKFKDQQTIYTFISDKCCSHNKDAVYHISKVVLELRLKTELKLIE